MDAMIQILAKELSQDPIHVENVVKLIDEGNTIPFIARYRKELHGAMDDTALRTLADRSSTCAIWKNAEARSRPLSTGRESSLSSLHRH